jgi:hypothetical protein
MAGFLFRVLTFLLLSSVLTVGCSSTSDPACSMQPLCDGTDGATYLATNRVEQLISVPGRDFVTPNGEFEVIDGQCRFWTSERRTGQLTNDEADQLSELGGLGCFERLAGLHEVPGVCDGSIQNLEFRGVLATARNGCGSTGEDAEIAQEIRTHAANVRAFLSLRGGELDGPVWCRLSEEVDPELIPICYANPRDWPLDAPATEGTFLIDPPEAATLRALAAEVLDASIQDQTFYDCGYLVPVRTSDGELWRLFVRDAIPVENQDGSIFTRSPLEP